MVLRFDCLFCWMIDCGVVDLRVCWLCYFVLCFGWVVFCLFSLRYVVGHELVVSLTFWFVVFVVFKWLFCCFRACCCRWFVFKLLFVNNIVSLKLPFCFTIRLVRLGVFILIWCLAFVVLVFVGLFALCFWG